MNPEFAKPFIKATKTVLASVAALEVAAETPYVKKDNVARGDISAIIGITGDLRGTFSISFDKPTAVYVVKQMLGDAIENILQDVQDAVGEISNMISGHARVGLSEMGVKLQGSTPTVIMGDGHTIAHMSSIKPIAIPFTTQAGSFTVEFCLED